MLCASYLFDFILCIRERYFLFKRFILQYSNICCALLCDKFNISTELTHSA